MRKRDRVRGYNQIERQRQMTNRQTERDDRRNIDVRESERDYVEKLRKKESSKIGLDHCSDHVPH